VIDALYPTTQACSNCGLRFTTLDADGTRYRRHLDWHFREAQKMQRIKDGTLSSTRQWFFTADDWVLFSAEASDEQVARGRMANFDAHSPRSPSGTAHDSVVEQPVIGVPEGVVGAVVSVRHARARAHMCIAVMFGLQRRL